MQIGMMFCSLVIVYPAYHFWSYQRLAIADDFYRMCWDYIWLCCYAVYFGKSYF